MDKRTYFFWIFTSKRGDKHRYQAFASTGISWIFTSKRGDKHHYCSQFVRHTVGYSLQKEVINTVLY